MPQENNVRNKSGDEGESEIGYNYSDKAYPPKKSDDWKPEYQEAREWRPVDTTDAVTNVGRPNNVKDRDKMSETDSEGEGGAPVKGGGH